MGTKKIATRNGFGEAIVELGRENKNILVVDVDIGKSCKTGDFRKELPEQYINVGIAEQNAAGLAAGLVYKLLENKNRWVAVISAAVVAPIVNTGIFLLGCRIFFFPTINEWAAGAGFESAGQYMIFGLVGLNFVVEAVINIALSSIIVRVLNIIKKPAPKAEAQG